MTSNEATILSELTRRPIAYHRAFATIGGGACAGLMLSQAYYWTPRTTDTDGWFYKTQEEWEEETGLTRTEQETSRRRLKERGLLEEKRAGVPAKLFYRVDTENVLKALMLLAQPSMQETRKLEAAKPADLVGQNPQSITETTAETTTEKTFVAARSNGHLKTPLPEPFVLTPEMKQWAKMKCPTIDSTVESDNFQDYHRARASKFADWVSAWRTWMRNAQKWHKPTMAELNRGGAGFVY